jgi:hypothetical protein
MCALCLNQLVNSAFGRRNLPQKMALPTIELFIVEFTTPRMLLGISIVLESNWSSDLLI